MCAMLMSPSEGERHGTPARALSHCHSDHVIKGGKTKTGKPRYTCAPPDCPRYALQLKLTYIGRWPAVKEHIVDMRRNGSGMRDTTRGLKNSPTTVMHELKKASALISVNDSFGH